MEWLNGVWEFLNQPLPIVGVSLVVVIISVVKIISTTSFGKKTVNKIKDTFDTTVVKFNELEKKYYETENALKEQVATLKADYEERLKTVYTQFDYFEKSIFECLEKIPNQKVQEQIALFKQGYEAKKQDLGLIVAEDYAAIETKIKEIEELKASMIEEFNKVMEEVKNASKETIDSLTTEE